jgi:hypothetical protein
VAVIHWGGQHTLAECIADELTALGHRSIVFPASHPIPAAVDVLFTFHPYGKLAPIARQLAQRPAAERPFWVHWNTEGLPDLRIPWPAVVAAGALRSWLERCLDADSRLARRLSRRPPFSYLETRVLRYRYVGDYHYLYRHGLLGLLADSSEIYTRLHRRSGIPTVAAPWGASARWYRDLGCQRDIDVLWMGYRATRRRSRHLDQVREALGRHGVQMHVADNVEQPFIYEDERTHMLNRAKITLNLTRAWHDDNISRLTMAMPNRSLVVSEPLLPHCPAYTPGVHYVAAPVPELADRILYYLSHDEERLAMVERAYQLATEVMPLRRSAQRIFAAMESRMPAGDTRQESKIIGRQR